MLRLEIQNDGIGDEQIGFYDWKAYINHKQIAEGRVEWHHRAEGWHSLLQRVVDSYTKQLML